jgi:hypothetical protein
MTENPYAIPVDELVGRTRVPVTDQVEVRSEPQGPPAGWSADPAAFGDGAGGDADGE